VKKTTTKIEYHNFRGLSRTIWRYHKAAGPPEQRPDTDQDENDAENGADANFHEDSCVERKGVRESSVDTLVTGIRKTASRGHHPPGMSSPVIKADLPGDEIITRGRDEIYGGEQITLDFWEKIRYI